jgi:hypothetical protein
VLKQIQAGGGQRHGLAHALEQGHAQARLDGRHLSAERRLRQPQLARGGRQRAGIGRFQKRMQLIPVEFFHAKKYMTNTDFRYSMR